LRNKKEEEKLLSFFLLFGISSPPNNQPRRINENQSSEYCNHCSLFSRNHSKQNAVNQKRQIQKEKPLLRKQTKINL
jgi:predicted sulfurtransferase